MLQFAANLTMMYTELPFLERFSAAAQDGFAWVEYLFPYQWPASKLSMLLRTNHLQQVLLNAPPGDWQAGDRGVACIPGREAEFRRSIDEALRYAEALECPRIHVMAGVLPSNADRAEARATYVSNLAFAAEVARGAGREVLVEPINPYDIPGYFLNRQDEAHTIVAEIEKENLGVQMDLYHCRRVEGDVAEQVRRYVVEGTGRVRHLQIAGFPGRHEPDTGDLDYAPLLDMVERSQYRGWIGCEYIPSGRTSDGLGWFRARR